MHCIIPVSAFLIIMNPSDIFHLKWDEFQDNFRQTYKQLRQEEEFCDVTLVCGDGKHIEAHKLILSASSTVFKDIFTKNKQGHPLLYLRGVESTELASVMDFIYQGEVKVPQTELSNFLDVAQDFGVKGLMNIGKFPENVANKKARIKKPKVKNEDQRSFTEPLPFDYDFINDNIKFEDVLGEMQDQESFDHEEVITSVVEVDGTNAAFSVMNNSVFMEEIEEKIEEMIFVDNGCWGCKKCGKVMRKKQHIKNHAESHLEGYCHPCPICGKSSKTRNALSNHISYFHKHPMAKMPMPMT
eukprot:GFUD01011337.1.p1 GENE.GFUD01011337.1~~GFUD01011337.1.p1  ORF type:complete len:299 (-),score=51.12 GFUD01011337.1:252-1148(-)